MASFFRSIIGLAAGLILITSPANAGTVQAKLTRGTLTVSGKCDSPQLSVMPGYSSPIFDLTSGPDSLEVRLGTTSLGTFQLEDVDRVVVKARGNLDYVLVSMLNFIDVSITTGANSDLVEVNGCIGNLDITTGEKNDTVCLASACVRGATRIATGAGDDVVTVGTYCPCLDEEHGDDLIVVPPVAPPEVSFLGDVTMLLGGGRDELYVFAATFGSSVDEVDEVATLLDVDRTPLLDVLGIKVRIHGGGGRDSQAIYSSNIPLDEYAKSFQFDIAEETAVTPGL